jgi:hypothetical protein
VAKTGKRSVRAVIDEAIAEGRRWEWLCYALVVFCALLGATVLIIGVVRESGAVAIAESIFASLLWPCLRYADAVRRDLVRTRLCEMALVKAKTTDDVLQILREIVGIGTVGNHHAYFRSPNDTRATRFGIVEWPGKW